MIVQGNATNKHFHNKMGSIEVKAPPMHGVAYIQMVI